MLFRSFSVQPAFFVTLIFAVLWFLYDFMVLLPSHNQMNQLLAHAELGIDARKFLRPSLFAKHWMPEAWEAMYNADPVVDEVGTGSKSTLKGQIAPVAAASLTIIFYPFTISLSIFIPSFELNSTIGVIKSASSVIDSISHHTFRKKFSIAVIFIHIPIWQAV